MTQSPASTPPEVPRLMVRSEVQLEEARRTTAASRYCSSGRCSARLRAGWTQEQYDKSFRYEQAQAEIDALRRRVAELEQDLQ